MGYSFQGHPKVSEGAQHPDRDAQFEYLNAEPASTCTSASGDLGRHKRKELVGEFANGGKECQPEGEPARVNVHDFPDPEMLRRVRPGR